MQLAYGQFLYGRNTVIFLFSNALFQSIILYTTRYPTLWPHFAMTILPQQEGSDLYYLCLMVGLRSYRSSDDTSKDYGEP